MGQQASHCEIDESSPEFSLKLYQALQKNGNVFISPYSISTALMILLLGAEGETEKELKIAMYAQGTFDNLIHVNRGIVFKRLMKTSCDGILITIGNRIYSKEGVALKKAFKTSAAKYYDSAAELLDFAGHPEESRQKINSWIEQQTNDKIKDLIPPNLINGDTMMILTNAIYFKGSWDVQFNESSTLKKPFYVSKKDSVEVKMMTDKREAISGDLDELNCKYLQLPYKGETLSMLILLPNDRSGLEAVENGLNVRFLLQAMTNRYRRETVVTLPKFRMESTFDLTKTLPMLGIKKIFESSANFNGIFESGGDGIFVSDFIHKAYVELSEEGTEAAAATAVVMTRSMVPEPPFEFNANHPFLFFIFENESFNILFVGRCVKPS